MSSNYFQNGEDRNSPFADVLHCFWFSVASWMQQGCDFLPRCWLLTAEKRKKIKSWHDSYDIYVAGRYPAVPWPASGGSSRSSWYRPTRQTWPPSSLSSGWTTRSPRPRTSQNRPTSDTEPLPRDRLLHFLRFTIWMSQRKPLNTWCGKFKKVQHS